MLEPMERAWAPLAAHAAAAALESGQLLFPATEDAVAPFLQALWACFSPYAPPGNTVHSKGLDVARAGSREYYGFYSMQIPSLRIGEYGYGEMCDTGKGFIAGAISMPIFGTTDWHCREIVSGVVTEPVFYKWDEPDLNTDETYDPTGRPWYRHAVERGQR